MIHLITGGSASGKSNYGELYAKNLYEKGKQNGSKLIYIATMFPYQFNEDGTISETIDEEVEERIKRHQQMRFDRGFYTIECYTNLEQLILENKIGKNDVLLLECMSNLLANECYLPFGRLQRENETGLLKQEENQKLQRYIINPVKKLAEHCQALVIISNEIFSDTMDYSEETKRYIYLLAMSNQKIAEMSNTVTEVVCGIPVILKS